MRKKLFIYTALIAGFSIMSSSCAKIKSAIAELIINWDGTDVTFDVPIITDISGGVHSIGTGTFSYNIDSLIKNKSSNTFSLSNIDEFKLASCTITVNNGDPTDNNISNFESADATLATSANPTPVTIGSVTIPNTNTNTLSIPVNTTTNLKTYIASSGRTTFIYTVNGDARRVTTKILNATAHITYSIKLK